jgi:hypothetical protein
MNRKNQSQISSDFKEGNFLTYFFVILFSLCLFFGDFSSFQISKFIASAQILKLEKKARASRSKRHVEHV